MYVLMNRIAACTAVLLVSSSLLACSPAEPPAPQTGGDTPATQPGGASGQANEGEALVSDKCSQCHSIDRVDTAVKDRAGWESTVSRMEKNGLELTDAERTTIIDWLAERDADR